jgi:hypothetical protein
MSRSDLPGAARSRVAAGGCSAPSAGFAGASSRGGIGGVFRDPPDEGYMFITDLPDHALAAL